MNTPENHTTEDCPVFEDISAFYDGELAGDSHVAKHISECPACREVLDSLKKLDEKVRKDTACEIPEGLSDRIKSKISTLEYDFKPQRKTIAFPVNMFLKVAAAVVVCSGITFMVMQENFNTDNSESPYSPVRTVHKQTSPASSSYNYPYYTSSSSYAPGGGVALQNLTGASYGNSSMPIFTDVDKIIDKEKPVKINSQVHQVWTVKNLNKAQQELSELLMGINVPSNKVKLVDNGKSIKLIANLSKLQLVTLVKTCNSRGFELISPAEPQPEQKIFLGKKESPVIYYAEFVKDK